ncbi:MAG: DNA-binding protein WhiA [Peptococcaceae bacterium]|jgi:DNA-binding protein WhiA|nr:DNA-binding protein WhiA [Peptococcaceae bacterium]
MAEGASFSVKTKNELARVFPEKICCKTAELSALVRMDGTVTISAHQKTGFFLVTDNSGIARKIYRMMKDVFNQDMEITVKRKNQLRKNILYQIQIRDDVQAPRILEALGIWDEKRRIIPGVPKDLVRTQCCRRSYLRGVFLGAGSVSRPEASYHLEITASHHKQAQALAGLVNRFAGMQAKIVARKQWHVVYLKDSEQIADFLNIVGAHQALMEFENIRIMKGMNNQVHRRLNCETANLTKTVDASIRQVQNIRRILDTHHTEQLTPALAELAELRLQNPVLSLKELGEMMDPPVGKSGVNHRMRKLEALAEEIEPAEQP